MLSLILFTQEITNSQIFFASIAPNIFISVLKDNSESGVINPELLPLAPAPQKFFSTRTTLKPLSAKLCAAERPAIPPPTTTTSVAKFLINGFACCLLRYQNVWSCGIKFINFVIYFTQTPASFFLYCQTNNLVVGSPGLPLPKFPYLLLYLRYCSSDDVLAKIEAAPTTV